MDMVTVDLVIVDIVMDVMEMDIVMGKVVDIVMERSYGCGGHGVPCCDCLAGSAMHRTTVPCLHQERRAYRR